MRTFIKKSIYFILITLVVIFMISYTTLKVVDINTDFKVKQDTKYLVFGHSHPECAFNDSIISNFQNLAYSGEHNFYTYLKIKKVLSQNKHIDTIFVEYTNDMVNKGIDKWLRNYSISSANFYKYSPYMDYSDFSFQYLNNKKDFIKLLSKSIRMNLSTIVRSNYKLAPIHGGYQWFAGGKTDSIVKTIKGNTPKNNKIVISEKSIYYLSKIVEYCKTNEIEIYFIRSPQHQKNPLLVNETAFLNIKNKKFPNIKFLDYTDFPLTNEEFGDLGHLNYKGATKFSVWFDEQLLNGFEQDN